MTTKIVNAGDAWEVWIGLDGDGDPTAEGMGFIVGAGPTRDEAVRAAVADLEAAVDTLQLPDAAVMASQAGIAAEVFRTTTEGGVEIEAMYV